MKSFIFSILLLTALLIPTSAFASTVDTSINNINNQVTFQSIVNGVVSFFCGTSTTSPGFTSGNDTTNENYSSSDHYSEDDCNTQPPPYESDEIWKRWYCGGGEWGSF